MSSSGRVAVVTGAAAGIGFAIASRLARDGYDIGVADLDRVGAERAAEALQGLGRRAAALCGDVGDRKAAFRVLEEAGGALGGVDLLVNNAGIARLGPLATFSETDWRELFRVNVDGVFFCCQAALPGMLARRRGNIVNISSWNGKLGAPNFGAYSATKAAVISLTQALAREVASHGIRVNAVCPGIVAGTPMRREVERAGLAFGLPPSVERAKTIPLGRLATPEDIAGMVAFLASEEAAYMTGQAVNVTGGLWLH
ncbi:MAG TPA: SDR family NAD(P)-dependent oxidoreductase [Candidatus Sulfotelmatobacter sp.]|nr:SDR family NAD(P)-dependent oxidoreductase [Candidatus Sulfotelmatobacter sp.]